MCSWVKVNNWQGLTPVSKTPWVCLTLSKRFLEELEGPEMMVPAVQSPLEILLDILMKTKDVISGATYSILARTLEWGAKVVSTKIIISF